MKFRLFPLFFCAIVALVVLADEKENAEKAKPAASTSGDDATAALAGVVVQFKSGDVTDSRIDRLIAIHVPAGQPATSFLPAGPFTATYTGNINVGLRGRYSFSLEGQGKVKVTLAEKVILEGEGDLSTIEPAERIRLNKGENPIIVEYTSPAQGDATMRLHWQSDEFPREQIHPAALSRSRRSTEISIHQGRELFATMRCVKCHTPADDLLTAKNRMPELESDAPNLTDIGSRLNPVWMAHWIQNPKHFRADATMPRLTPQLQDETNDRVTPSFQAQDIAEYLYKLGEHPPIKERPPITKEVIAAGGNLFASLGCIGCHTLPDHQDEKSVDGRVSLKWVTTKFQPHALPAFLMNPQAHYAWIRMPNFKLSEDEANLITAFLWSRPGGSFPSVDSAYGPDAARGKQLVASLGCLNCHDIKAKDAALTNEAKSPSLAEIIKTPWKSGCLADDADAKSHGRAPRFGFDGAQREALAAFALAGEKSWKSLTNDSAREFSARQIQQLQCTACHKRDGVNDRWSNHEGEVASLLPKPLVQEAPPVDDFDAEVPGGEKKEAQIDQSRPELTWVGEKLKPQWMEQFFAGKLDYKLRPWLTARMPAFPARAKGLAQGLALEHGFAPMATEEPKPDAEAAKIGRQLVGRSIEGKAGFACVQCHGVGDKPAENVFEAQGINFAYSKERLRHEFYMRWMLKPARVQPGTRMPQFAADDGTTPFADVYGGDGRKQFDAIWQYLLEGRELKAP